jgi:hypothetical protein
VQALAAMGGSELGLLMTLTPVVFQAVYGVIEEALRVKVRRLFALS